MNPEIKELWVEALESGEYTQGKKVLHNQDNNTFCCLGVLCDLAVKAGLDIEIGEREDVVVDIKPEEYEHVRGDVTTYDNSYTALPASVMEWAGIEHDVADFWIDDEHGGRHSDCLTRVNDAGGTFESIATIIKEKF